ncbi:5-formyltetrahydrofolate cyclo-ligase [Piscinibacter sakaiensis]|uniref:5-formyltetrahydrofolate cyclo-ligase n=1 Tax=Piscinibacter sakaiensis TaxID=1547922 RepID=UPI003AAF9319
MQPDATRQARTERPALRTALLAARDRFVAGPAFAEAETALQRRLVEVLHQLEPDCLGLYWPMRSEFNAVQACAADASLAAIDWALPFCRRANHAMDYRLWNKRQPVQIDECGLGSGDGRPVVPDVVVLPCVGYSVAGYRLGYGAGYFDRWQAAHPHVTAVGVAWSVGLLDDADFRPEPHDQPLMLVVTELGVVGG